MQTLSGNKVELDLREALDEAGKLQPLPVLPEVKAAAFEFMVRRLEQLLVDTGSAIEVARAVLGERASNPMLAQQTAAELQASTLDCNGLFLDSVARRDTIQGVKHV